MESELSWWLQGLEAVLCGPQEGQPVSARQVLPVRLGRSADEGLLAPAQVSKPIRDGEMITRAARLDMTCSPLIQLSSLSSLPIVVELLF